MANHLQPSRAFTAVTLAAAFALLGLPFVALVADAVVVGPASVLDALTTPQALGAVSRSIELAAVAVVVNGAFGVACALVLVRQRFWFRGALDAVLDLPLGASPVMSGLAFILLTGRNGWLSGVLDVKIAFAFPGLVVATLFVTLPFCAREVSHLLEEVGDVEEQAAATLGASAARTFFHVTLPNIAPALASGVTLTAARALGEFGAVLVVGGSIGGRTDTATTFLYSAVEERREPAAVGVALLLSAASMALLACLIRFKRRGRP